MAPKKSRLTFQAHFFKRYIEIKKKQFLQLMMDSTNGKKQNRAAITFKQALILCFIVVVVVFISPS